MLLHFSGTRLVLVCCVEFFFRENNNNPPEKSANFSFCIVQAEHFWLWPWCLCLRLSWKFLGNKEQTLLQSCGKSFCSREAVQYGCGTVSFLKLWERDFFSNPVPSFLSRQCLIWNTSKPPILWLVQLRANTSTRNYFLRLIDFLAAFIRHFSFNVLQIRCVREHICTECILASVQPRRRPKRGSSSERCHFRELITGGLS